MAHMLGQRKPKVTIAKAAAGLSSVEWTGPTNPAVLALVCRYYTASKLAEVGAGAAVTISATSGSYSVLAADASTQRGALASLLA